MTVSACGVSSDDGDRSVLAPTETDAQGLSERSKIRYTRSSLVSLQKSSIKQELPRGIEPSALSELGSLLQQPWEASSSDSDSKSSQDNLDKGLLSSENIGLLRSENGGLLRSENGGLLNSENGGLLSSENVGLLRSENVGLLRSENVGQLTSKNVGLLISKNVGQLSSNNVGQLSFKNVGLLGAGSQPGASPLVVPRDIADAPLHDIADVSQPVIEENITPLLHKCKEPYRPPHLVKSAWTDYKDEVWISPEPFGKNEGCKQNWRREYVEEMRERQKETFNNELKKASSEQIGKNVNSIPLELSENDDIIASLAAEPSENAASHLKSPATCVDFANHFAAIEQKPAYGISCTKESELIGHINHSQSTTEENPQLYDCKIPAVILGVLQCVGLEHIFTPETKEFSCSMLWDGFDEGIGKHGHHGSDHLMLLPEQGTERKDKTTSSDQSIASNELQPSESITDNKLASSVGRPICKFFFPIVNKNNLASAAHRYTPNVINSEAIVFSSAIDESKGMENQAVSDAAKLNHVFCSDVVDSSTIELCLPDEESLITVKDFRVMSYKDILEKDQAKPDRISTGAAAASLRKPMDTNDGTADEKSTHVTSAPPVQKRNLSYRATPALINSQVQAVNPQYKPQMTSNQAFATNVFPQQMITTTYMPDMYNVQGYLWNYQMPGYGCVPLPLPTAGAYGGTNFLGTQNNAGTSYIGWQQ